MMELLCSTWRNTFFLIRGVGCWFWGVCVCLFDWFGLLCYFVSLPLHKIYTALRGLQLLLYHNQENVRAY